MLRDAVGRAGPAKAGSKEGIPRDCHAGGQLGAEVGGAEASARTRGTEASASQARRRKPGQAAADPRKWLE